MPALTPPIDHAGSLRLRVHHSPNAQRATMTNASQATKSTTIDRCLQPPLIQVKPGVSSASGKPFEWLCGTSPRAERTTAAFTRVTRLTLVDVADGIRPQTGILCWVSQRIRRRSSRFFRCIRVMINLRHRKIIARRFEDLLLLNLQEFIASKVRAAAICFPINIGPTTTAGAICNSCE